MVEIAGPAKTMERRPRGALFAAALLVLVSAGLPAFSATPPQPNAQQLALYEKAPEDERVRLLISFAKSGGHELTAVLLQRFPLRGPLAANRTLYLEGLILKGRRDYTGAAKKFRAALADDPSLTLVRADLAQTLVILEEDESAIHHLKLLESEAPNEQEAAGVRAFIDQVNERSPFKFNFYVSAAPTTNVNNGSAHAKIYAPNSIFADEDGYADIGADSQKKSGLGMAAGANAAFTRRLGNDFSFVAGANGEGRIYDDPDFNSLAFSQSAEIRYLFERGYLGLGAVASENLKTDELGVSYYSYGPRAALRFSLRPQDTLALSVIREWRDYAGTDATDGVALMVDASLSHAFNSSFNATLFAGYDDINAELGWNAYQTWSAGLGLYRELPKGITAEISGEARFSDFDDVNIFIGETRRDRRYSGNVTLTKRDWNIYGFAPSLSYTYTRNLSNIELYDFDAHAVDLRLTKDF